MMNKDKAIGTFTKDSVDKLEECLRGEHSAVETYDLAVKHIKNQEAINTLKQVRESHNRRANLIRERLRTAGSEPTRSATVWSGFGRIVQAGTDFFADKSAFTALLEGEDRCVKMYTVGIEKCDPDTRRFIETDLRQEQEKGLGVCRSLQRFFQNT